MSLTIFVTHAPFDAADLVAAVDRAMEDLQFVPAHEMSHLEKYVQLFNPHILDRDADPAIRYIEWQARTQEINDLAENAHLGLMYLWREPCPARRYFENETVEFANLADLRGQAEGDGSIHEYVKVSFRFERRGSRVAITEVYFSEPPGIESTLFILQYLVAFLIWEINADRVQVHPKHAEDYYFVYEDGASIAEDVPWW
jgi:hypothetical protein